MESFQCSTFGNSLYDGNGTERRRNPHGHLCTTSLCPYRGMAMATGYDLVDNLHAVRTSSYYVQQLFSRNKGNQVLPLTMNQKPVAGNDDQYGLFASAVWDNDTREIIVKVVNTSGQPQKLAFNFDGLPPRKD